MILNWSTLLYRCHPTKRSVSNVVYIFKVVFRVRFRTFFVHKKKTEWSSEIYCLTHPSIFTSVSGVPGVVYYFCYLEVTVFSFFINFDVSERETSPLVVVSIGSSTGELSSYLGFGSFLGIWKTSTDNKTLTPTIWDTSRLKETEDLPIIEVRCTIIKRVFITKHTSP